MRVALRAYESQLAQFTGDLMSQFDDLKNAKNLHDIASLLGYKPRALSYILYKLGEKYKAFEIPKRYSGVRKINAPHEKLKRLQRKLADMLQNCISEIDKKGKTRRFSHGFSKGYSIITNAVNHRRKRFVFNVDLKDFFGTINFGRVRGFFIVNKDFMLNDKVATILAQIASHDNALPQGSPCSPVISNLIGHILDVHLGRLAARHGCIYSRYADDITFSTNKKEFPHQIAEKQDEKNNVWMPGKKLLKLVKHSGFELNYKKTRMQCNNSRQEVTGLTVNERVNVSSNYRRNVRAMVHRLLSTGEFHFERARGEKDITGSLEQLHGMLGFIDHIDKIAKKPEEHEKNKKHLGIYQQFLLYKVFYTPPSPIILCEGETDNIYLLYAIRSLAKEYPLLAEINSDNKIKLKIQFFKYKKRTGEILGLSGGASPLAKFISHYSKFKESHDFDFKKINPVIVLVDNDDGLKDFNSILKIKLWPESGYIHYPQNLYIIKTPSLNNGKETSEIEDFFPEDVRNREIDGKKFSANKKIDKTKEYGKTVFAHKIVRPGEKTINFEGFRRILSILEEVIEKHSNAIPVTVQTPPQ